MASLKLSHIYKVYDNGHKAVNDFNIDIKDREFIVFVGPSGCGKSTTLRMIAGLEEITTGDLFIGDTLVNDVEPKDRDIAMVFQNYALYPHMTVYENMAFGLRNRKVPEAIINEKVMEAAKILDIEDYLERKPKAMSGGQRQRVALGRAIVRDPKVFLLDEPLSNLDAKLRATMRTEITKLHKKLGTTFIYVTHDQVEAMTMGTRIVVMKLGYVQQIDTPMNLYNKPGNKFVAGFIGTPQMNFFDVTLDRRGDDVNVAFVMPDEEEISFNLPYVSLSKAHDKYLHDCKVCFGIRPEHISIVEHETGIKARVNVVERLGNESIAYCELGENEREYVVGSKTQIVIKTNTDIVYSSGDIVNLEINPSKVHFFDLETELSIISDIPAYATFDATVSNGKLNFLGSSVEIAPVLANALGDCASQTSLSIEVPPSSIVPGSNYSLKVSKVEKFDDQYLATLAIDDRFIFALVDESVKEGDTYKFDLLNDKIRVLLNGESLLNPVPVCEALMGMFTKEDVKKSRDINFYYEIGGNRISAPQDNGHKIFTVEGNACYKTEYKYEVNRKNIQVVEEGGVPCKVKDVLNYLNAHYALVDYAGQDLLIEVDSEFAAASVNIVIDGKDIAVYNVEIDLKLC